MKYIIIFFFSISLAAIISGLSMDLDYSPKLVGGGVVCLFFVVFPLFSWYRWKDKKMSDYLLNKENLDKMRENQKRHKL